MFAALKRTYFDSLRETSLVLSPLQSLLFPRGTMTLRIVLIRDCQSVILLRDSRKVGAEGWQLRTSRKKNDRAKRKRDRSWQAARETREFWPRFAGADLPMTSRNDTKK